MAGAAVGAATGEILKRLISIIAEEINLAWGLKGDLKTLSEKLTMIHAVLHDAEGRPEESVKHWMKRLRNVAYDAEDVVDEFAFESLRRKLEIKTRMKNKVCNFFSLSNPIGFRFKMTHKIRNINMRLEQIVRDANAFGLRAMVESSTALVANCREIRLTHPFVDDSEVVGRDGDVSKVVDLLLNSNNEEEDLSIIAIVGMAGQGKTTLAQLVYKNETVMRHFNERTWICVSGDFDVSRLLKETVESFTNQRCEITNIESMVKELQTKLNGQKYLMVLDDVWNTNPLKWDGIRSSLQGIGSASKGSKILITTRSDEVIKTMQITSTHHLEGLSGDDSWTLFKQKAFASGGPKDTSNLVNIGKTIVERCAGLPLAIKMLGALMYSKEEREWLSIQNSETWNLIGDVLLIIKLSFDHLPSPSLKQCFAYCSIFPKDCTIEKDTLIQLWMAQGFLQSSQGSNLEMEDTGNDYVKILLWNSLFQDAKMDIYGNIMTIKMHDLVHDLARDISGSEWLTLGGKEVNFNPEARHLTFLPCEGECLKIPKETSKQIRTLVFKNYAIHNLLLNFKCLRHLDLSKAHIGNLLTSIGELKHLRYLDVSKTMIQMFPNSIGSLYNLQTLRLMNCHYLYELPQNLKSLFRLRHICFKGGERWNEQMPVGMGQLTCLQTLPLFSVGQEAGRQIEELGCLKKLKGEIKICNLEHVKDKEEAERAKLSEKTNVYKLEFKWRDGREGNNNDEDVLEGLQPQPNLKSLRIRNFLGDKFPPWMMLMCMSSSHISPTLNNLVEIKLIECNRCEQIPTLGQLSHLVFLEIQGMHNVKCIGREFYSCNSNNEASTSSGSEPRVLFPALKRFTMEDMEKLVEWKEAAAMPEAVIVFPCLEELSLDICPVLRSGPSHFSSLKILKISGITSSLPLASICSNLTFLEELSIWNCRNIKSIQSIQCARSLRRLEIWSCDELTSLQELESCTSLEFLNVQQCPNLKSFPQDLREFHSLSDLKIRDCGKLNSVPKGLHCLTRLETLQIGGFSEELDSLANIYEEIGQLHHLRYLSLGSWRKLKSLPHQLRHLNSLVYLGIKEFEGLEALPEWLGELSSLEYLEIYGCKNLRQLPPPEAMRRLTNLKRPMFVICPLLSDDVVSRWCDQIKHRPS